MAILSVLTLFTIFCFLGCESLPVDLLPEPTDQRDRSAVGRSGSDPPHPVLNAVNKEDALDKLMKAQSRDANLDGLATAPPGFIPNPASSSFLASLLSNIHGPSTITQWFIQNPVINMYNSFMSPLVSMPKDSSPLKTGKKSEEKYTASAALDTITNKSSTMNEMPSFHRKFEPSKVHSTETTHQSSSTQTIVDAKKTTEVTTEFPSTVSTHKSSSTEINPSETTTKITGVSTKEDSHHSSSTENPPSTKINTVSTMTSPSTNSTNIPTSTEGNPPAQEPTTVSTELAHANFTRTSSTDETLATEETTLKVEISSTASMRLSTSTPKNSSVRETTDVPTTEFTSAGFTNTGTSAGKPLPEEKTTNATSEFPPTDLMHRLSSTPGTLPTEETTQKSRMTTQSPSENSLNTSSTAQNPSAAETNDMKTRFPDISRSTERIPLVGEASKDTSQTQQTEAPQFVTSTEIITFCDEELKSAHSGQSSKTLTIPHSCYENKASLTTKVPVFAESLAQKRAGGKDTNSVILTKTSAGKSSAKSSTTEGLHSTPFSELSTGTKQESDRKVETTENSSTEIGKTTKVEFNLPESTKTTAFPIKVTELSSPKTSKTSDSIPAELLTTDGKVLSENSSALTKVEVTTEFPELVTEYLIANNTNVIQSEPSNSTMSTILKKTTEKMELDLKRNESTGSSSPQTFDAMLTKSSANDNQVKSENNTKHTKVEGTPESPKSVTEYLIEDNKTVAQAEPSDNTLSTAMSRKTNATTEDMKVDLKGNGTTESSSLKTSDFMTTEPSATDGKVLSGNSTDHLMVEGELPKSVTEYLIAHNTISSESLSSNSTISSQPSWKRTSTSHEVAENVTRNYNAESSSLKTSDSMLTEPSTTDGNVLSSSSTSTEHTKVEGTSESTKLVTEYLIADKSIASQSDSTMSSTNSWNNDANSSSLKTSSSMPTEHSATVAKVVSSNSTEHTKAEETTESTKLVTEYLIADNTITSQLKQSDSTMSPTISRNDYTESSSLKASISMPTEPSAATDAKVVSENSTEHAKVEGTTKLTNLVMENLIKDNANVTQSEPSDLTMSTITSRKIRSSTKDLEMDRRGNGNTESTSLKTSAFKPTEPSTTDGKVLSEKSTEHTKIETTTEVKRWVTEYLIADNMNVGQSGPSDSTMSSNIVLDITSTTHEMEEKFTANNNTKPSSLPTSDSLLTAPTATADSKDLSENSTEHTKVETTTEVKRSVTEYLIADNSTEHTKVETTTEVKRSVTEYLIADSTNVSQSEPFDLSVSTTSRETSSSTEKMEVDGKGSNNKESTSLKTSTFTLTEPSATDGMVLFENTTEHKKVETTTEVKRWVTEYLIADNTSVTESEPSSSTISTSISRNAATEENDVKLKENNDLHSISPKYSVEDNTNTVTHSAKPYSTSKNKANNLSFKLAVSTPLEGVSSMLNTMVARTISVTEAEPTDFADYDSSSIVFEEDLDSSTGATLTRKNGGLSSTSEASPAANQANLTTTTSSPSNTHSDEVTNSDLLRNSNLKDKEAFSSLANSSEVINILEEVNEYGSGDRSDEKDIDRSEGEVTDPSNVGMKKPKDVGIKKNSNEEIGVPNGANTKTKNLVGIRYASDVEINHPSDLE